MGWFSKKPQERTVQEREEVALTYEGKRIIGAAFHGDGDYETPVAGLAHHQADASALARDLGDLHDYRAEVFANLIREPANPHDSNAIRVEIDDWTVGYVARDYARIISDLLDSWGRDLWVTCPARVDLDGHGGIHSIRLDVVFSHEGKRARDAQIELEQAALERFRAAGFGAVVRTWTSATKPVGEVLGESQHVDTIATVVRLYADLEEVPRSGAEAESEVFLVPLDQAVIVTTLFGPVGHLEDSLADACLPRLKELERQGRYAGVRARFWSGAGIASVRVDVGYEGIALPVNGMPEVPYEVLPTGRLLQVTKEEGHLEYLLSLLGQDSERPAWVTLHEVEGRGGKASVEARIDGQRVGVLSGATATEILPLVRHLATAGRTAVAPGLIRGSALKVDVAFRSAKASEVGKVWLDEDRSK